MSHDPRLRSGFRSSLSGVGGRARSASIPVRDFYVTTKSVSVNRRVMIGLGFLQRFMKNRQVVVSPRKGNLPGADQPSTVRDPTSDLQPRLRRQGWVRTVPRAAPSPSRLSPGRGRGVRVVIPSRSSKTSTESDRCPPKPPTRKGPRTLHGPLPGLERKGARVGLPGRRTPSKPVCPSSPLRRTQRPATASDVGPLRESPRAGGT